MQKITSFLMFDGKAEEAMNFYLSVFPDASRESIVLYGAGEGGPEGKVKHAVFSLFGQRFMCIDSVIKHGFTSRPRCRCT